MPPQIEATPGMPERKGAERRQARVRENLHLLPKQAQEAILESFENDKQAKGKQSKQGNDDYARHRDEESDTASIPTQRGF